jgi:hypothetical protein
LVCSVSFNQDILVSKLVGLLAWLLLSVVGLQL